VGRQWVGYSAAPDAKVNDRMDHVAFATDNIVALRRYLISKGIKPVAVKGGSDHSLSFMVADPEWHPIEFVERGKAEAPSPPETAVSRRMIHAGFIVYNRDLENHFQLSTFAFHIKSMLVARVQHAPLQFVEGSSTLLLELVFIQGSHELTEPLQLTSTFPLH